MAGTHLYSKTQVGLTPRDLLAFQLEDWEGLSLVVVAGVLPVLAGTRTHSGHMPLNCLSCLGKYLLRAADNRNICRTLSVVWAE